MKLPNKTYKTFDLLRLVFVASPISATLLVLLTVIRSLAPTAAAALATASFVDTATAILEGTRPHDDIYLPLAMLLVVLLVLSTAMHIQWIVFSQAKLKLHYKLKPAVVLINASLNYEHIENADSWELITRVSRDPANTVLDGFGAIINFLQVVISVASVLILILTQVWWAALIIAVFSTPMVILSMHAGRKNYQAERDAEKFNRRTEYLGEVLAGRDAVDERALFSYGDTVIDRWREQYEAGRIMKQKVMIKTMLVSKSSSLILALISLLIALTLINPVVSGEMSAGMFMGIIGAVFGMVNLLGWQLSASLMNISKAREYMRDLTDYTALGRDESSLDEPDAQPGEFKSLEFRNVSFRYPTGDRLILDGLSFTLKPGLHYAFVGKNGAGKTTITKLLTGLYTGYEGEILVNGKELRTFSPGALKAMFSIIYQDFAKYYISLRDNIALGDAAALASPPDSSKLEGRIADAVRLAGLEDTAAGLGDGIDTPLGKILEGGQDISGGQWQSVAIARSLLSRAPVKMLDEPTAALDPISESHVYSEFEKLMRGKTTVFISHRLGSTKLADEILVIDDGRIIERGSHDALIQSGGQYAVMFEAQRGWYL